MHEVGAFDIFLMRFAKICEDGHPGEYLENRWVGKKQKYAEDRGI
jgi:hypothetical protein